MSNKGWICLYRDIENHWIWSNPDWLKWWLWLLMHVNIEDKMMFINGESVACHRGEIHTSIRKLSETLGTTPKTAKKWLDVLEREHMISTKRNTHGTTIKVLNYAKYQDFSEREKAKMETPSNTRCNTPSNTPSNTRWEHGLPTTKQYNNINNKQFNNNIPPISPQTTKTWFDSFWKTYPKKRGREEAQKEFEKICKTETELKRILDGVEKWKKSNDWKKNNGRYIQSPVNFLKNRQWEESPIKSEPAEPEYKKSAETSFDIESWKRDLIEPPTYKKHNS